MNGQKAIFETLLDGSAQVSDGALLGGRVLILPLDSFVDDRGTLTPVSFAAWRFTPVRAFAVCAPAGSVRGGHAHRHCRQILMRVSGEVDVDVDDGHRATTVRLDDSCPAVLVEPGVWSRQTYLSSGSSIVVFCDRDYDPKDYVQQSTSGVASTSRPRQSL